MQSGLVREKQPQFTKRPFPLPRSLRSLNRYPGAEMRQLFKGNAASGAFGLLDKAFTDTVIHVALQSAFLPGNMFELTAASFCSDTLQSRMPPFVLLTTAFNTITEVLFAVAVRRKIDDAEINTENIVRLNGRRLRQIDRLMQEKYAITVHQISLSFAMFKALIPIRSHDERHEDAPHECGDGGAVNAFIGQHTIIQRHRAMFAETDNIMLLALKVRRKHGRSSPL